MRSANIFSHEVFGMEALPVLRIRTLFQHIVSHHCKYSVREHCVNTPVVGAFSVLRVGAFPVFRTRTLCQHSGCRSILSTPYQSTMSTLRLSEHSQYSVLEHCVNTPVVGAFSVLRTRALGQHSGCRCILSTPCRSILSTPCRSILSIPCRSNLSTPCRSILSTQY